MNERIVSIQVKLNMKDYHDFCYQAFLKLNKKLIIIAIVCIAYLPIPILNIITGNKEMPISIFFFVLSIPLLVFVVLPIFMKRRLNKVLVKDEFANKVQAYKISDNNISISSDSGETTIGWNEVYKLSELKSSFVIFLSEFQIFVIPKRVFKDKVQVTALREIIHSHLPAAKLNS